MVLVFFLCMELLLQLFEGEGAIGFYVTLLALGLALVAFPSGYRAWRVFAKEWEQRKERQGGARISLFGNPPDAIPLLHPVTIEALLFVHAQGVIVWALFVVVGENLHIGFHVSALLGAVLAVVNRRRHQYL
jgi:hypothetical protein